MYFKVYDGENLVNKIHHKLRCAFCCLFVLWIQFCKFQSLYFWIANWKTKTFYTK